MVMEDNKSRIALDVQKQRKIEMGCKLDAYNVNKCFLMGTNGQGNK